MTEKRPVALITGGRRGIGRGIAFALADAGFDLVINDLERDVDAETTLAGVAQRGARASFVAADLADLAAQPDLVEAAFGAFGRLDCLVNNAGISVLSRGDLLDVSVDSYDRCLATNLRAPFFLTQRIARRMLEQATVSGDPPRSIVTITSVNAKTPSINRGEYQTDTLHIHPSACEPKSSQISSATIAQLRFNFVLICRLSFVVRHSPQ
jgi:NAD(P)-dependent dehydrogenase (short-subunit alcohol dehydrogenase family)